jgi:hypothetical protein
LIQPQSGPTNGAVAQSLPRGIEDFLARYHRSYLFVRGAGGEVRGWPMTSAYDDRVFTMTTYKKSPKVAHLSQAARATLVVVTDEGMTPVEYAVVEGALRLVDILPDTVDALIARMGRGGAPDPNVRAHYRARLLAGKRVLIEVEAERVEKFVLAETPS